MEEPQTVPNEGKSALDSVVGLDAQLERDLAAARSLADQRVNQARMDAESRTARERDRITRDGAATLKARQDQLRRQLAEQSTASTRETDRVVAGLNVLRDRLRDEILKQVLIP